MEPAQATETGRQAVTVGIPVYNDAPVLSDCVTSILAHPGAQVIIVYEADCTDDTAAVAGRLAQEHDRVRALENPAEHAGSKAGACNLILKEAETEMVGLCDADHEVRDGSIQRALDGFAVDEELAYLSGRAVKKQNDFWSAIGYGEGILFYYLPTLLMDRVMGFHFTSTAICFFRQDVLDRCGGFDTEVLTEDMELGMRLFHADETMRFDPGVVTEETAVRGVGDWWRQKKRWIRGALQVSGKHRDEISPGGGPAAALVYTFLASIPMLFPALAILLLAAPLFSPLFLGVAAVAGAASMLVLGAAVYDSRRGHLPGPRVYHLLSPLSVIAMVFVGLHALYEHLTGSEARWHKTARSAEETEL